MKFTQYFEIATRNNGEQYIFLKEDAPNNLKLIIYSIHEYFDCLPNDWIYSTIFEALQDLEDNSLEDCSIESNCYHTDLYKWFGEPYAKYLCDEALVEYGCTDIYDAISCAQRDVKQRIYTEINDWLEPLERQEE